MKKTVSGFSPAGFTPFEGKRAFTLRLEGSRGDNPVYLLVLYSSELRFSGLLVPRCAPIVKPFPEEDKYSFYVCLGRGDRDGLTNLFWNKPFFQKIPISFPTLALLLYPGMPPPAPRTTLPCHSYQQAVRLQVQWLKQGFKHNFQLQFSSYNLFFPKGWHLAKITFAVLLNPLDLTPSDSMVLHTDLHGCIEGITSR